MTVALGEVDPSYLWDGAQEGWKLEASEAEIRLTLHVGKPLGELPADQLDALREILGDARYNHLSTSQTAERSPRKSHFTLNFRVTVHV